MKKKKSIFSRFDSIPDTISMSVGANVPEQLYILNNSKIFPLRRDSLKDSVYFEKLADEENKFILIQGQVEVLGFKLRTKLSRKLCNHSMVMVLPFPGIGKSIPSTSCQICWAFPNSNRLWCKILCQTMTSMDSLFCSASQ